MFGANAAGSGGAVFEWVRLPGLRSTTENFRNNSDDCIEGGLAGWVGSGGLMCEIDADGRMGFSGFVGDRRICDWIGGGDIRLCGFAGARETQRRHFSTAAGVTARTYY